MYLAASLPCTLATFPLAKTGLYGCSSKLDTVPRGESTLPNVLPSPSVLTMGSELPTELILKQRENKAWYGPYRTYTETEVKQSLIRSLLVSPHFLMYCRVLLYWWSVLSSPQSLYWNRGKTKLDTVPLGESTLPNVLPSPSVLTMGSELPTELILKQR